MTSSLLGSGMTRAPVVRFPTAKRASQAKLWMEDKDNFDLLADVFNSTTRFAAVIKIIVINDIRTFTSCSSNMSKPS